MPGFRSVSMRGLSYFELTQYYRVDEWSLEEVKAHFEAKSCPISLTINQWKSDLKELKIFKILFPEEKSYIRVKLAERKGTWSRLFIVGDVLFENAELEKLCKRQQGLVEDPDPEVPSRREVWFVDLPFNFDALQQPDRFKNFQRLLFYATVHFENSFYRRIWARDDRGLYARSPMLQAELKRLSKQHNLIFHALRNFKANDESSAEALVRTAKASYVEIVDNLHHRQIHDILAIMYMLHRAGKHGIQETMGRDLSNLATRLLPHNDPRREMLACVEALPLRQVGDHYIAFDKCCRDLWARTAGRDYKAHYSYNQASFPRIPQPGFYSIYDGKSLHAIADILRWVDTNLDEDSPETFSLWLTALNYLWDAERYEHLKLLARILCCRISSLDGNTSEQLNLDSAVAFYLLGRAEEEEKELVNATQSYVSAVEARTLFIPVVTWDSIRAASLERLIILASRVDDEVSCNNWKGMLKRMYDNL